jgi:hypothetical protein
MKQNAGKPNAWAILFAAIWQLDYRLLLDKSAFHARPGELALPVFQHAEYIGLRMAWIPLQ